MKEVGNPTLKYMRSVRIRKQQTQQSSFEVLAALPKMSRQQFSDAIRIVLRLLGDSWNIKQTGFGHESTYKLFLRPYEMKVFRTRDSGPLPAWVKSLRSSLPLSPKQILALADSREAYCTDLVKQDKTATVSMKRDGLLKTIGLPLKEVESILETLESKLLDPYYSVWHNIDLSQVETYHCSYFDLEFDNNRCHITIRSRMEQARLWKEARKNFSLYFTVDELFALETLFRLLSANYQTARWCCQAPGTIPLPGRVIRRYKIRGYSLGYIETPLSLLLTTLEETRLVSTLANTPVFVPCSNLEIQLRSENSSSRSQFFPPDLLEQLRTNLSEWLYDSRHVLDLGIIWNVLYPGDWC